MNWKALFSVRNYIVEEPIDISYGGFGREVMYEIHPTREGTDISIAFDTEVSKPPFLQRRRAEILLSMLKEVSAPYILDALDTELVEVAPADDESRKHYDSLGWPSNDSWKPKPKTISDATLRRIANTFAKVHPGGPIRLVSSMEEHKKSLDSLRLEMILKWYSRSMEFEEALDRFISLWVTFNMLYQFFWIHNHPDELQGHTSRRKKRRISNKEKITKCVGILRADECKTILERHAHVLSEYMWSYELRASRDQIEELEEAIESKDIEKIEEFHRRSLRLEREESPDGTTQRERAEKARIYGLDFGKYWLLQDWVNSLVEVLLHIYNLRNNIFHSGAMPEESTDPDIYSYWMMVNDVLSKINANLIRKMLADNTSNT